MRIQELTENYFDKLKADAQNLLMSALANGETEVSTDSLVKELNQMKRDMERDREQKACCGVM